MYLKLDQIHKEFDSKVAVDHLSLAVPRGVIYGIIGPNGAGKTTTIRMIMDIIKPDSGTIYFDDKPVDSSFKERVGYLPEERGLYKKMTVAEVVVYMAELKGYPPSKTKKKLDGWLERLNLSEYRDGKVEELSKGMQQKLQFITTLMHEPDIIILDELFSGLDPINMELMKDILMDQKREGKTVLFSTHVMEQAEKLCDHLCMINKGNKVIDGKMADVKAQFGKNSIQMEFEGDAGFMRSLPGVAEVMTESNNFIELHLAEGAKGDDILKAAVEKLSVRRFETVEPSLYSIFIDVAKVDPSEMTTTKEAADV
jgi:ABC-2 type transport system ATP-binding protein